LSNPAEISPQSSSKTLKWSRWDNIAEKSVAQGQEAHTSALMMYASMKCMHTYIIDSDPAVITVNEQSESNQDCSFYSSIA